MQTWSPDGVRSERTGWRDEAISSRHRAWGFNCPAVDLDFMMAEYNHGIPVALVEYKDSRAREPILGHPTYRALAELANGYRNAPLPFFIAVYNSQVWSFRIIPANDAAANFYGRHLLLSESRFVRSLYVLRKTALTDADNLIIEGLNKICPDVQVAPTLSEWSPK